MQQLAFKPVVMLESDFRLLCFKEIGREHWETFPFWQIHVKIVLKYQIQSDFTKC